MEVIKICSVYNLKLYDNDTRVIYHDYLLSNDLKIFSEVLFSQKLIHAIGLYSYQSFGRNSYFFSGVDINENDDLLELSHKDICTLQEFVNFLWFAKDNSCNMLSHFTYVPSLNEQVIVIEKATQYTTCTGTVCDASFSKEEILLTSEILFKAHQLSSSTKQVSMDGFFKLDDIKDIGGVTSTGMNKIHYGLRNRVERALMFVGTMRTAPSTLLKISLGMNILECLFSDPNGGEIAHKIAERTALYIGETNDGRKDIFKLVKSLYTIRSKYFHGQRLLKKDYSDEKLISFSMELDNLLRLILTKVIMTDGEVFANENDLTSYFNDMIFNK